jgi:glutamine synthetase
MAAKLAVVDGIDVSMEEGDLRELADAQGKLYRMSAELSNRLKASHKASSYETAVYFRDEILSLMQDMRVVIDQAEKKISSDVWPLPTYADIIFRV